MIKNIAVMFGGRSCEHEISILSAIQVMSALEDRYHIIPLYLTKQGEMYSSDLFKEIESYQDMKELLKKKDLVSLKREGAEVYCVKGKFHKEIIDFVLPIMHGTNGEDGAIQGYLEIFNLPYAGSSVLPAALAQSKITSKILFEHYQIPTLNFHVIDDENREYEFLPCIIKPDHLGSSIGIQIVKEKEEWDAKSQEALLFDDRCLVEPYIDEFREINCSVMKCKGEILCSHLEEVQRSDSILSFKDKYESSSSKKGNGSHLLDLDLSEEIKETIYNIAKKVYASFQFQGVIRIDFMLIENEVYVNEINTIPGSYAFYLWKEKTMCTLLEEAIKEGVLLYQRKMGQITSFQSDVLFHFQGTKKGIK